MNSIEAIIIAIVEGLTEFLPVSSTGHMIITQNMLGVESTDFVKAFTVIIQFGAILSVVCLYWNRFFRLNPCKIFDAEAVKGITGVAKWKTYGKRFLYKFDFYWKLLVAFLPAAVIGFLFSDAIDSMLENVWVVAVMLVIGGVFMLFVDKLFNRVSSDELTEKKALYIGFFQCIAMIPGVSRSMATIVGGMSQKLSRKTAAEFSFFSVSSSEDTLLNSLSTKSMKTPPITSMTATTQTFSNIESMASLKRNPITAAGKKATNNFQ
jgi:undecaprenyl-diphosphatase